MKLPLIIIVLATTALAVRAEDPKAPRPNATLEVRNVTANRDETTTWQAEWGSYNKRFARLVNIEVKVSTVGRVPVDATATYYFIGRSLTGANNTRSVVKQAKQPVNIPHAPGFTSFIASSGAVASTDNRYYALGQRDTSGSKIEGWIVVLSAHDGTPLDAKASSTFLLDYWRKEIDPKGARALW